MIAMSIHVIYVIGNHLIKSLLKHMNVHDFKNFDQNSSVFQSENLMTTEFL
jgi:hypothetical protein